MAKRGRVTTFGDAQIVADGGSPESEVAAWWDGLDAKRRAIFARACGAAYQGASLGKWEDLSPFGQQMPIHMWYDHPANRAVKL
jgi:hypothetical protein